MNNLQKFLLVPIIFLLLVLPSCNQATPTLLPITSTPSVTPTPSAIASATAKPTFIPTPSPTNFPTYPLKSVLIEYGVQGDHSLFEVYTTNDEVKWVLYDDGQLIIETPKLGLMSKDLSKSEVCLLFKKLEILGLYDIETNYKNDLTDPLYNFGNNYTRVYDDLYYYLFVNGESPKTLGTMETYREFLVPRMKKLLGFVDNYFPSSMTKYQPDRLLIDILDYADYGRQPTEFRPLPENLLNLSSQENPIYLEGSKAAEMYNYLYAPAGSLVVYSWGDKKYYVIYRVIFPHESVDNQNLELRHFPSPYEPMKSSFDCG